MLNIILRLPAIKDATGYSRSTLYSMIARRQWTQQVRLGPRSVGWPRREVEALNSARIAGRSDAEIRELVIELEAARKTKIYGNDNPSTR